MRKTLLIAAMLLLVAPVMAATTVKVNVNPAEQFVAPDGNKVQPVTVSYVTDVNVRAFALDINIDTGPTFSNIRNFKVGESNAVSLGYGIFPSRFRDFVTVAPPNWNVDVNYNPTVAWNEPGSTNTGMGYGKFIVEMGTLYAGDANKPAWSGTLFKFDVNAWTSVGTFHITVAPNTLRGGVVGNDGNTITATMEGNNVSFAAPTCTLPNVVSQPESTATASITAAGFTLGTRTTACSDVAGIVAGDIISTNPVAGSYACGSAVAYVVSTGPCCVIVPNVVGQAEATATANITAAGLVNGTRSTACDAGVAAGNIISTNPANPTCIAAGSSVNRVVSAGTGAPGIPASITVPANANTGKNAISWTAGTGAASYVLESTEPSSGTAIWPQWVTCYTGTNLSYTHSVGGGTWSYRVKARNVCGDSGYRTGGNSVVDVNCLVGGVAGTNEKNDWRVWRYPACWCYKRQCRGDINGKTTSTPVALNDFNLFTSAYGKTDSQLVALGDPNLICADLNHKKTSTRVALNDFNLFTTYYGKSNTAVPDCNLAPIINGTWNYWTTP